MRQGKRDMAKETSYKKQVTSNMAEGTSKKKQETWKMDFGFPCILRLVSCHYLNNFLLYGSR